MSIKRKVLTGVVAVSLFMVLAGWASIRYLGLEGFKRLDEERAANDALRVAAALDKELEHMQAALRFKSVSDITYRYAVERDPAMAANYFSWEALKGSGLNLVVLFSPEGKVLEGGAFDLKTREAIPLATILGDFPEVLSSIRGTDASRGMGLIMTPLGPMFVCFQPVLNSMGWGPSRGMLAAGRFAGPDFLAGLGTQLKLPAALMTMKEAPPDIAEKALRAFREGKGAFCRVEGPDTVAAYAVYPGILGGPDFLLKVDHQRSDPAPFNRAVYLAALFVGMAGVLVFVVTLFMLRRALFIPLGRITSHIEGVKDRGGLGKALDLERTDEIGQLARAFDSMSSDLAGLYDRLDRQHGLLAAVIDAMPHPVSLKDASGRYVLANKAMAELLGLPAGELAGNACEDAVPGARWAVNAREAEMAVLASFEPASARVEAVMTGGGERLFETTRLPMRAQSPDGQAQVLTVMLDITGRVRSENELRQSERRFRSLFESMTEGVCLHEVVLGQDGKPADYRILDVNPAFERILGISRDKAVGVLASGLYGAGEAPFLDMYAEVAATARPVWFETFFEPLGKHFHVSAFSPRNGQFATVFMDTTEQKRNREALERARLEIQHILDSMPSPVIGLDEKGLVANVNAAAAKLSENGPFQADGLPLAEAFPALAGEAGAVDEALRKAIPALLQRRKVLIGGEQRLADIQVYPMLSGGVAAGAVVRLDDVTERARMEEVVLQTEKMMSVGGLAAGMAHEINNPLGGILQSVQIIKRRLKGELPANGETARRLGCSLEVINAYLDSRDIFSFLDAIQDAGARAARIVANMLEFSRRSESKHAACELDAIMDKALELAASDYDLKKKYDFKRIEVVKEYDESLPEVRCTQTELEQVILNLIKNAAQALAGGASSGAEPRIILRAKDEGSHVRLEVEDNGPGMTEAVRKRAFEPFFTTKPPGIGTGLGLSVSYFIVTQNHGGEMYVESQPDRGARFVIRMPCVPPPLSRPPVSGGRVAR
ncbi:MAG: PAS domain-containing protein [Thermodesulfobacteriota bacterium]